MLHAQVTAFNNLVKQVRTPPGPVHWPAAADCLTHNLIYLMFIKD